ncbi:UPF0149 family protein [Kaarinaea lacus]
MKDLFSVLNDEELEQLDEFLVERIDEDIDSEGKDEGVLDVSELDGFFTAIVSGPELIQPSRWLPEVWGEFEPEWESEAEFENILSLMMRHMNSIAATLMQSPEDFEPLFMERKAKGKTYTIVDEWCHGYMRGVSLCRNQWDKAGEQMSVLLMPIVMFASEKGWEMLEKASDTEVENLQNAITPSVREIHAYWLARRGDSKSANTPIRRESPRVGRNDPCPCGSGKKYKKCCLH